MGSSRSWAAPAVPFSKHDKEASKQELETEQAQGAGCISRATEDEIMKYRGHKKNAVNDTALEKQG